MRHSFRSLFLLSTLAAASTGCQMSTDPHPVDVAVAVTPSRTRLPAGEAVVIEAVITNVSSDTAWVPGSFPTFLEVRDAAGHVVAFGRFAIVPLVALPPRPLAPREEVVDRALWAGELNASPARNAPAAPGVYHIRAAVPLLRRRSEAYAYSPPVAVELVAAP